MDPRECDYQNIGWEGFLEVYRNQPGIFSGSGRRGWQEAARVIYEKLAQEKATKDKIRYGQISLDIPISAEIPVERIDLLRNIAGDFQNSVCLRDYINELSRRSPDAGFLARRFMEGDTLDEVRHLNHWGETRTNQAWHKLREVMEDYWRI